MLKILHFADAHIDMENYGRHDPQSGLPMRVMDFLKSLDTIVDTAIDERVDLVLFAGDAFKDRTPAPTFIREWGKRIMRLSHARIPTLMLVGNHDLSPALGRAHALEYFATLEAPFTRVLDKPCLLGPDELFDVPLQLIALPWVSRAGLMAHLDLGLDEPEAVYTELGGRLEKLAHYYMQQADPSLPLVLTAHCSVQGATYGQERQVLLGGDLTLSGSVVKDPRLAYVALGHIHKPQDLNAGHQPPVIYPGSIERVDFGEAHEKRYFVIADIGAGDTHVDWRELTGVRPFIDCYATIERPDEIMPYLLSRLPSAEQLVGAIVRLTVEYPRAYADLIDESALREATLACFDFRLNKKPQMERRIRLPDDQTISSMPPPVLLDMYWRTNHMPEAESQALNDLALPIFNQAPQNE